MLRWLVLLILASSAALAADTPIVLRDTPLLFVDDAPIAVQQGVVRTFYPARTRAAPVIEPDRPWEGGRVYTYGSLHFDATEQRFWLWYQAAAEPLAPTLRRNGQNLILFATSSDGVTWEKPALGIHAYNGSTANNIVFDAQSPAVIVDRFERDPARRYKLLAYFSGGYVAAFSADGVHWQEHTKNPVFAGNDTMSLTQNPRTGEFLAYFKKTSPTRPGRVVWLTRSRDFAQWSEPTLVFQTDAEDNRWATTPGQRTDVYDMTVLPHAGGFIGLPAIFRVMTTREKSAARTAGQSGQDGPIDVQMVTSTDGATWQRTSPRINLIPRGAPGTFDGGVILGLTSNAIDSGDETWLCYTAINTGHGASLPTKRITIGRATWRRHGFASLDASPAGGSIETHPVQLGSPAVIVNADASRGTLRVGLLEADGRSIPGYECAACEPLRGDATRWRVRWKDGAEAPTDRAVRLRFELISTQLYSITSGMAQNPDPRR
jgi:hypothetical protein